jgi:hypothetical protein
MSKESGPETMLHRSRAICNLNFISLCFSKYQSAPRLALNYAASHGKSCTQKQASQLVPYQYYTWHIAYDEPV